MSRFSGVIQFNKKYTTEQLAAMAKQMQAGEGKEEPFCFADNNCAVAQNAVIAENKEQKKVLVFRGSIYNYASLKEQLLAKDASLCIDNEARLMLCGITLFGDAFIQKPEGVFIFALYDGSSKTLLLGRDKLGAQSLYYYQTQDVFLFSSELESILASGIVPKKIDKTALSRYLQLTYIPAPVTIIENLYKLPPATIMSIGANGQVAKKVFWSLDPFNHTDLIEDYEECKKQLREKMFASVEQKMASEKEVGAFLSGGFDSSIVVGVMSQISEKPVNTFTIGFADKRFDESETTKIVAKKNHTNHTILTLDWDNVYPDIDHILNHLPQPYADSSLIAAYIVSKKTSEHVNVALTGDLGDELFAGYNKYLINYYNERYNKIPKPIRRGVVEPAVKLMPAQSALRRKAQKVIASAQLSPYERRKNLMMLGFKPQEMRLLMLDGFADEMHFIQEQYEHMDQRDEQTRAQYVDFVTVLEGDMMPKTEIATSMAPVEIRVPMSDTSIMELAYQIPTRYKINNKDRKIILKDTFRDLLPEELFKLPKTGFSVPIGEWLETILKDKLLEYAGRDFLQAQGLFNYEYINTIINNHLSHKENRYSELWAFYVFQSWYERVILRAETKAL